LQLKWISNIADSTGRWKPKGLLRRPEDVAKTSKPETETSRALGNESAGSAGSASSAAIVAVDEGDLAAVENLVAAAISTDVLLDTLDHLPVAGHHLRLHPEL
jgi:hypothetical protein